MAIEKTSISKCTFLAITGIVAFVIMIISIIFSLSYSSDIPIVICGLSILYLFIWSAPSSRVVLQLKKRNAINQKTASRNLSTISTALILIVASFCLKYADRVINNVNFSLIPSLMAVVGEILYVVWFIETIIILIKNRKMSVKTYQQNKNLKEFYYQSHSGIKIRQHDESKETSSNTISRKSPIKLLRFDVANKNVIKIIGFLLVAIIIASGLIISFDYLNYRNGNRSMLFGTLDAYSQEQTLKLDKLDFKVNDVSLNNISKPTVVPTAPVQTDCSNVTRSFIKDTNTGLLFSPYTRCTWALSSYEYDLAQYNEQLKRANDKLELIVEFQYTNISTKPANLKDYSVKLIANTTLGEYSEGSKACTGIAKNESFLSNYVEKECLLRTVDKGYSGPLAFSVTKNGKEKIINLKIPTN